MLANVVSHSRIMYKLGQTGLCIKYVFLFIILNMTYDDFIFMYVVFMIYLKRGLVTWEKMGGGGTESERRG